MVIPYLKSIRYLNLLLLSILFWGLMIYQYQRELTPELDHFWLFTAILFTTICGYQINNYYDIPSDKINQKAIDKLSEGFYLKSYFLHFFFSFLVLFISDLSGQWFLLIMFTHLALIAYSARIKNWPLLGNIIIAILCSILVIIPEGLNKANFNFEDFNLAKNTNMVYVSFCFALTLIREIIKDMEDINGDKAVNSKTLPIILGIKSTKFILGICSAGICFVIINCLLASPKSWEFVIFFILLISLVILFIYRLIKANEQASFKELSKLIKVKFLTATIWLYFISFYHEFA